MFSLDMLDCPMSSLSSFTWNFLCWMGWGDHSKSVLLLGFLCGTPPSCSKVTGWWVVVGGGGGLQDFSVSPGSESLSLSLSHWAWVPEPSLSLTKVWVSKAETFCYLRRIQVHEKKLVNVNIFLSYLGRALIRICLLKYFPIFSHFIVEKMWK